LAAGEALEHTLGLLVQVMASETLDAHGAVLFDPKRDGFDQRVSHPGLHPELERPEAGGDRSPWEEARRTGEPFAVHVDDLPEPMRTHADEAGHEMCWVWPVTGEGGGVEACLVAWRAGDAVTPDFTRVRLLESLVRLARLAFERDRTHARLEHAATHDPLTHLANRARFYDALEAVTSGGTNEQVGVLYLDLDGFKPVNDSLGHGAGDDVLLAVARRLTRAVRDGDLVARLGGDEFAVLCPAVTSAVELEALAARLVEVIAEPFEVRGQHVPLGVSVGAAIGTASEIDGDRLVEAADRALYQVKNAGKSGWKLEVVSDSDSLAGARLSSSES
jgi:diguanylate cyclase (GGDEF)-like protein